LAEYEYSQKADDYTIVAIVAIVLQVHSEINQKLKQRNQRSITVRRSHIPDDSYAPYMPSLVLTV